MADTFVMSARQAAELDHALERNGWTPADVKALSKGDLLARVRSVLLGHASIAEPVIDCDAQPRLFDGWSVEEHQKGGAFKWDKEIQKNALYLSKGQAGSKYIEGNKLRQELSDRSTPVLNANALDYLLDNPHLIPKEWKGKYVFFWGTVYRDNVGNPCVRGLYWQYGTWTWSYHWLDRGFGSCDPVAVRAS